MKIQKMGKASAGAFGSVVNRYHSQWPAEYVEKHAMGVIDGSYDSICPAAGTDIFYVRKVDGRVVGSTRAPDGSLLEYEELMV